MSDEAELDVSDLDRYMGVPMYPWSVARLDNPITERRDEAMRAVSGALCRLPAAARQRLVGINLLGETHQLYPDFETGMGTDRPYVVTDYSPTSRAGLLPFGRPSSARPASWAQRPSAPRACGRPPP